MAISLVSCSDNDNDGPKVSIEPVEIALLEAAPIGELNEEVEIHVRTVPHNGCWCDIEVQLVQHYSRHFTLKAKGTFIRYPDGACPYNLVLEDTIIRFTPSITGQHYFKANADPFTILRDTLEVD